MPKLPSILFSLMVWAAMLYRFGYLFATGDVVETYPYILFLHNHSLFLHDFFLQGLHTSVPNERTVFAYLLLPFVNCLPTVSFLFFGLTIVLLTLGLEQLLLPLFKQRLVVWVAILFTLLRFNEYTLGDEELFYLSFQASYLAVAIIAWALVYFFQKRYVVASVLMSIASLLQLLEGLDVMLVLTLLLAYFTFIKKEVLFKTFVSFLLIYGCTAGVYLAVVMLQKINAPSAVSTDLVWRILFEFRHPHHYLFAHFPLVRVKYFFFFALVALVYFYGKNKSVFSFILIALLFIGIYGLLVQQFHSVSITGLQLYKLSKWVKMLGVAAFVGFIYERIIQPLPFQWNTPPLFFILCVAYLALFLYKQPNDGVEFQFGSTYLTEPKFDICLQIKQHTPPDACFIVPFENSELKYYAQRSAYVEFKACVKNPAFVGEWYRRVGEVYGINDSLPQKGFKMQPIADYFYNHLDSMQLLHLKQEGVTHVLSKRTSLYHFPSILANQTYHVYQL